jgi:hypothetical protein
MDQFQSLEVFETFNQTLSSRKLLRTRKKISLFRRVIQRDKEDKAILSQTDTDPKEIPWGQHSIIPGWQSLPGAINLSLQQTTPSMKEALPYYFTLERLKPALSTWPLL